WRIGGAAGPLLEVSCPRIPCATFARWLEEQGWVKRFTQRAVPGPYLRVIEPRELAAGDPLEGVHRPAPDVTLEVSLRAPTTEPGLLPRLLVADALPAGDLAAVRTRLAKTPGP